MPETTANHTALLTLLKQLSFKEGDFTLSSGKKSHYYLDGRMTTLSAQGALLIGQVLYDIIAPLNVDAVGGLTLGADPIVTAVCMTSAERGRPINGFLIRKEAKGHGTGRQIEGHLLPNSRVVLVEDVMTTGQSFIKAIEAVRQTEPTCDIVRLLALVDRNDGAMTALAPFGIPVQALFPIDAFFANATS